MYNTVLFDLDGTLTNPYLGITNGIMYALEKMGREIPSREELKSFIGPPLYDEFRRKFSMSDEQARTAAAFYREYYFDKGWSENELIDGARELLESVKATGRRVCLATCKPDVTTLKILEYFDIAKYFDFVGASTLDGRIVTKKQVLEYVLENIGEKSESCVLVGDRMHDIEGAHSVGMRCIAVLVGFGSREEFSRYGADYVAQSLSDVLSLI